MPELTRRRLISITANVMTATAVAGPYLPGLVLAQEGPVDEVNPEALATLVHDIFPHEDIAPGVYAEVARTIIAQEQGATGDLELIRTGLQALNELSGVAEWWQLEEYQRQGALTQIVDGVFFQTMLSRSRSLLYLRPEVWQLVGYGGNALTQGGYLTRGFDDIDWL